MSAKDCLAAKAQLGLINRALAKEAADFFDSSRKKLDGTMSAADADVQAGLRMQEEMVAQLARKKENRARMAALAVKLKDEIGAFRNEKGVADPGRAMLRLITRDLADKTEGVSNTWARAETVEGVAHSIAEAYLERTKPRLVPLRRRANGERVIRAAFGEAAEDADKVAWEAADQAMDYLRRRFNRAGGAIKFRKEHGPPQMSDMRAVARVSSEEFRDVVRPLLAPEKMYHPQTGHLGLSEADLDKLLPHLHEKIRTNGWAGTTPTFTRARQSLANRRMDARFLVFKDADSYFAYQGQFGTPDVHEAITSHLHGMSREIGQMEILGPNPDAMITYLKQVGERQAALEGLNTGTLQRAHHTFDSIHNEQTGAAMVPVGGREGFAAGFAATRNVLVSAILGSSAITGLTDLQTRAMTRQMAGISNNFGKRIRDIMRLFVPRSPADRRLAVRQGLLAESYTAQAHAQHRYIGETVGPRWSRIWADVVLRVSGLTPLTQSGRHTFGLDMLGHFGDYTGRSFTKLPDITQRMLSRYGIDAAQWARLSPNDLIEHGGTNFLDMRKFYETKEDLAIKFHELILTEREFAVPMKNPRARSFYRFGKPGTIWGEVSNNVAMLKTFPTMMLMLHVARLFKSEMTTKNRMVLASELFVGVTLFGTFATQMHEIARGRDPRKMDDPGLWLEGVLRGGGGGIIGDFLFHDMSQYGESWWKQLGGPLTAASVDVANLTLGNVWQAANGQKPRVGRELARFLKRYTPGSSIWWMRLALERKIWDNLARLVDPEATKQFSRRIRTRQKDHDQQYWWPPGQAEPSRKPDLAEAVAPSRS